MEKIGRNYSKIPKYPTVIHLFLKRANLGLFFIYFRIFKNTLQILQHIGM